MLQIENLLDAIKFDRLRITDHADEETQSDNLTIEQVLSSIEHGEVIEQYESDKPFPSCLVLGKNLNGEPIHSVWAYNAENQWAVLITVYKPDPKRWINWKERRK